MSIHTNTEYCWRLVLPTGEDWNPGDGVPHFTSEQAAMDARLGEERGAPLGVKAVRFDAPCVTVSCEECEVDPGAGDVFSQLHCQDVEEARLLARDSDWKVLPDGRTYCWDCPVPEEETIDA